MKKEKRWCQHFERGRCTAADGTDNPSLAQKDIEVKNEEETITLTGPNEILNFLALFDTNTYYKVLASKEMPKEVSVTMPRRTENTIYSCSSSNCRSGQKECDHYK